MFFFLPTAPACFLPTAGSNVAARGPADWRSAPLDQAGLCWPMDTNVLRQHDMALKQPRPEWEKTQKTKKAASLLQLTACVFCGAPEEIRTPGLQVRSLLLYPAELRARCEKAMYSNRPVLSNTFAQKIIFCAKAAACLPASGMAEGARQSLSPHSLPPGREQHSRPGQRICPTKNGAAIDGSNVPAAPPRGSPRQPEPQTA